jgi:hypothetical protein
MANPIKTATSTLIVELAENSLELITGNGHSGLTTAELRTRQSEVSLEIDRRIPIDTYVRSPALAEHDCDDEDCQRCHHVGALKSIDARAKRRR